jgi:hypothetical protein
MFNNWFTASQFTEVHSILLALTTGIIRQWWKTVGTYHSDILILYKNKHGHFYTIAKYQLFRVITCFTAWGATTESNIQSNHVLYYMRSNHWINFSG